MSPMSLYELSTNMLLRRNNEVLLSDFGNAVVIQSTLLQQAQDPVRTIAYMAPEQIRAQATIHFKEETISLCHPERSEG